MNRKKIPWYDIREWSFIALLLIMTGMLCFWSFQSVQAAAPNAPSNPSPANGSTGVSVDASLSWVCTDPDNDTLTYSVLIYHDGMPVFSDYASENQSAASYNPFFLYYNTTYFWRITATDNHSEITDGPLWNFTTETYSFEDDDYSEPYNTAFGNGTFSFTAIYEGVQAVYNAVIPAGLFYLFMFALVFGGIWIKQGDVTIPALLGMVAAPLLWSYIPLEYQYVCYWLFIVSIGGLIASIFKARQ